MLRFIAGVIVLTVLLVSFLGLTDWEMTMKLWEFCIIILAALLAGAVGTFILLMAYTIGD